MSQYFKGAVKSSFTEYCFTIKQQILGALQCIILYISLIKV